MTKASSALYTSARLKSVSWGLHPAVPPAATIHHTKALERMGMAQDVPTLVPTPQGKEEAASEPEGPEAASRL